MITYNIQLAHFKADQVEERGSVSKNEALAVLQQFPFRDELAKLKALDDGCLPTITFKDSNTKSFLAFWLDESEMYTIECKLGKHSLSKESYTGDTGILVQTLGFFFDDNWDAICQTLDFREGKIRVNPKIVLFLILEAILAFIASSAISTRKPHFSLANFFIANPSSFAKFTCEFVFYNIAAVVIIWFVLMRKQKS